MKFSNETISHLKGEKFAAGLDVGLDWEESDWRYESRLSLLADMARGKKIIHLGCVDHDAHEVQHKLARGKWLHKLLTDSAGTCLGVDISRPGIDYLHSIGITNTMVADITQPPAELLGQRWDYLMIPEVLEHIGSPVAFLAAIHAAFKDNVDAVVVTVPNAFARENFDLARRHHEVINSDHRHWYSPFTLAKVMVDAGFVPVGGCLCKVGVVNRYSFFRNWYFARHPLLRNGIVLVARFR